MIDSVLLASTLTSCQHKHWHKEDEYFKGQTTGWPESKACQTPWSLWHQRVMFQQSKNISKLQVAITGWANGINIKKVVVTKFLRYSHNMTCCQWHKPKTLVKWQNFQQSSKWWQKQKTWQSEDGLTKIIKINKRMYESIQENVWMSPGNKP